MAFILAWFQFVFMHVAAVELSCTGEDTAYCINDEVQYQCIVPTSDATLRWKAVLDGSNILGQTSYTVGDNINVDPVTIATHFTTTFISNGNPLTSFTADASYDGYVIQCDEVGRSKIETCNIIIEDFGVINVANPSCTSTSVQLLWTNNITNCITKYIINSTTSDNPITTTTSDTSYTLNISSLSEGVHYISVAGEDTGGKTGQHGNIVSVTISVPPTVNFTYTLNNGEGDTAIIELSWTVDEVCPPISSYYITSGDKTIPVPNNINDTYMYTISGIGKGTNVTITMFAENTIGNGTKHYEVIYIPKVASLPSASSALHTITASMISCTTAMISMVISAPSSDTCTHNNTCVNACTNNASCSATSLAVSIVVSSILASLLSVIVSSLITYLITKRYYYSVTTCTRMSNRYSETPSSSVPVVVYEEIHDLQHTCTNVHAASNPAYGHAGK